jgi:hypothetical protein
MTKDWPPPGHSLTYRVDEAFDNVDRISYDMSLPSRASTVNLATVRVGRHGGDAPEDLTFREELYQSVGSVTVAGGHVEAAMKRLLLLLTEAETTFSLVDYQWYELETKLRAQYDDTDERRRRLLRILDWANRHKLRERRHTVVHGAWWIYAGVGARVSRWPRNEDDRIIIGDMAWLRQLGKHCWAYAHRLDDLLGEDWPRAMLLAPQPPATFRSGSHRCSTYRVGACYRHPDNPAHESSYGHPSLPQMRPGIVPLTVRQTSTKYDRI